MRRLLLLAPLLSQQPLHAQSCDSLTIDSVLYAPFGGGLHATLHNGTARMLSGPMLDVYDADGDTVVLNAFNFFAIAPGTSQMNQLPLYFGATLPVSPFTGSLVLHYQDIDGAHTCIFPQDGVDLCPPVACAPLAVFAYQQGGQVETDLDWSVSDAENITQATGVLHMDTLGFGYTLAELCLPPGNYTLYAQQAIPAGNIIQIGMTTVDLGWNDGANTQLPIGGSVDLPFDFYEPCVQSEQGIVGHVPAALQLVLDERMLRVSSRDGRALGRLVLLDGMGRTAHTVTTEGNSLSTDLGGLASGAYILHSSETGTPRPAQRFILQ